MDKIAEYGGSFAVETFNTDIDVENLSLPTILDVDLMRQNPSNLTNYMYIPEKVSVNEDVENIKRYIQNGDF